MRFLAYLIGTVAIAACLFLLNCVAIVSLVVLQ
jgi:hypothetical protein